MNANNVLKTSILIILISVLLNSTETITASTTVESESLIVNSDQNLQEIIDAATSFSTIILRPGIYQEPLIIKKPINLEGKDRSSTFLQIKTDPNNAAITLKSSHIYLSNLTITNQADGLYTTAIRINEPNCTIQHCTIQNNPIGIAVWNSYTQILNSSFYNCSDEGILLISTSISKSTHNQIHHCDFEKNCDGIELQHSSYNSIKHCIFKNNTHSGIDAICDNNDYNVISNCTIINNTVHGIYFSSSQQNMIKNCYFSNNSEENIVFTHNSKKNSVDNNEEVSIQSKTESTNSYVLSPSNSTSPSSSDENNVIFQRIEDLIDFFKENILKLRHRFDLF
ncbi:MAG TPA: right-handed parallel beta-helix repeat-containing protein [Candidatus Thermoplasmatota archaeon]|nr:right-handed parallel beta-helix repeat-containing protein [Candidatus Thermoplasmatota archaeon]